MSNKNIQQWKEKLSLNFTYWFRDVEMIRGYHFREEEHLILANIAFDIGQYLIFIFDDIVVLPVYFFFSFVYVVRDFIVLYFCNIFQKQILLWIRFFFLFLFFAWRWNGCYYYVMRGPIHWKLIVFASIAIKLNRQCTIDLILRLK